MNSAVIIDVGRTPLGKRDGKLSNHHPVDLAAEVLQTLVARNDIDPESKDEMTGSDSALQSRFSSRKYDPKERIGNGEFFTC